VARLRARLYLLVVRLALGEHDSILGELDELVAEHPLNDRLRSQLMLALYRAGRQADALRTYRQFHHRLADELGIEPSRALQVDPESQTHDPDRSGWGR
jgi:DNA-binding SARP family transcriptional activator